MKQAADAPAARPAPTVGAARHGRPAASEAADAILEAVPAAMRAIRGRMRDGRPAGLSVPQFRALLHVRRNPGSSLSDLAEHLGTSLPATSELVARLVAQGLVARLPDPASRRRLRLTLTAAGADDLADAEARTRAWLEELLAGQPAGELARLVTSLEDLRRLLAPDERR